jgi:hypothetical protein
MNAGAPIRIMLSVTMTLACKEQFGYLSEECTPNMFRIPSTCFNISSYHASGFGWLDIIPSTLLQQQQPHPRFESGLLHLPPLLFRELLACLGESWSVSHTALPKKSNSIKARLVMSC